MDNNKKTNRILLLWYSHPRVAIALSLIAVNLLVIFFFTVVLSLVSKNNFFDELAYLFTYTMCSDGIYDFVNSEEDVTCFVIKIILTIIQMVIFSGALIGFTTDVLQTTFDKRLENKNKLYIKNHFVFLNWSAIGQNIIYDLSFLDGEKNIVILAEQDREEIINSIDNIFAANKRKRKGLRIFVKKGNPNSIKHLEDISIEHAKYVGILLSSSTGETKDGISIRDLTSFKLLLSMLGKAPSANIVVETESEYAKGKIEQLIDSTYSGIKHKITIFSHNSIIGHVLGRTVIQPQFSDLMHAILSFDGVEVYGLPVMDIEEALHTYNDCIPLVNYDDDDVLDEAGNKNPDRLYVLSDSEYNLGKRKELFKTEVPLKFRKNIKEIDFTLFILSSSNRTRFVVSELENHNKNHNSNIKYKIFSYSDDINDVIKEINNTEGERKLLLLSEEEDCIEVQDTNVFLALLEIKRNKDISENVEIYVELENINNVTPVRSLGIVSVILSNKIISLYMLQLMTHQGSKKFYRDLLICDMDNGEMDFEVYNAEELLEFENEYLEFESYSQLVQSFYKASNHKMMLIANFNGERKVESNIEFYCNKMDEKQSVLVYPHDKLIVVVYKK